MTGGLHGDFLPHGDYGEPQAGGLSRISRALELYRQPEDVLVDLGRFRHPVGISGESRRWRIRASGFLKAMTRLHYDAINVSVQDLPPWPPELADQVQAYDLPLLSSNISKDDLIFPSQIICRQKSARIRIIGMSGGQGEFGHWVDAQAKLSGESDESSDLAILVADASEEEIAAFCAEAQDLDLILWLNEGEPVAKEIAGVMALGLGDQGNCLGRLEIALAAEMKPRLTRSDAAGWSDGKSFRHHPAREALLSGLSFWRKRLRLRAYLWKIPGELSAEKHAEAQRRQTGQEADQYSELEEIHRGAPTEYAGSKRCLDCHAAEHPRDLARLHLRQQRPEVQDYPVYERCLSCHATGFDDPAGFLLPWERPDLLQVGCEACHGGSYAHALQGEPPFPPKPEEEVCGGCHRQGAWPVGHPGRLER
ncbi:MAG TPA: multiheme c-type cytochrome [bacterium]